MTLSDERDRNGGFLIMKDRPEAAHDPTGDEMGNGVVFFLYVLPQQHVAQHRYQRQGKDQGAQLGKAQCIGKGRE